MISNKSRRLGIILLAFIGLAAIVDWFLVPRIESDGHGSFVAVLVGSSLAAVAAWILLIVAFFGAKLFKKIFSK